MAQETQYNFTELFKQVWGHRPALYVPLKTVKSVPAAQKREGISVQEGDFNRFSYFGTPLIMPTKLDGFDLPNEPLIELNGTKTIIKTPLDGQKGTFKEHYSLGDYMITIKGFAVDDTNQEEYPTDIIRRLRQIFEKKVSVEIVNDLTTLFNITKIAIEDFKLPILEGFPGVQPYEFMCSSDYEFDLEIKKPVRK